MTLIIKNLMQKVKNKLDELESQPISNIFELDLQHQQSIARYNNILNNLRFIDYYNVDVYTKKRQYTAIQNDDVFRLGFQFYNDYTLGETILLNNDFNDLILDKGQVINITQ